MPDSKKSKDKLPGPVKDAKEAMGGLAKQMDGAGKALKPVTAALPAAAGPLKDASKGAKALKKGPPSPEKLLKGIPKILDPIKSTRGNVDDLTEKLTAPKKVLEGLVKKQKDVFDLVKPVLTKGPLAPVLKKNEKLKPVQENLAAAEKKLPEVPKLLDGAMKSLKDVKPPLDDAVKALEGMLAGAVPGTPPAPNAGAAALQEQISQTASAVDQAAAPVAAAAENVPAAAENVEKAQELIAGVTPEKKPEEIKAAMTKINDLIKDAHEGVAGPAASMPESARATGPLQEQLTAIQEAASGVLPGVSDSVPPEDKEKAAELAATAQESLNQAPGQMAEAAPAVQELSEQLPKVEAPLAEAVQAMHDAMEPPQQDLAELEEQLRLAEEQMALLQQQVDNTVKVLPDSEQKVGEAMSIEDVAVLKTTLDQIITEFPTLDDQPISDFENRLPDLEALVKKIEEAGNGGAA